MPTLVLSRRFSDDSNALWRAAVAAGWDIERVLGYEAPVDLRAREPAIYGETIFADALSGPLGLVLLEPTPDWLPGLPARYLRRRVRRARLGEARALHAPAFVKPGAEKLFPARVYAAEDPVDPDRLFDDAEDVLVAEPVEFELEVRAFVLERSVATLSAYVRGGEVARAPDGSWPLTASEESEARGTLRELLGDSGVPLPPAVVVDVGRLAAGGWAVVEANAAWGSGVCGCDPRAVLEVVARANVPATRLSEPDERWRRP